MSPRTAQFQISVRTRLPRGTKVSNKLATEIVREWIETGEAPKHWHISVVIWDGSRKREITEIDSSSRGEALRGVLRRSLHGKTIRAKKMGKTRT